MNEYRKAVESALSERSGVPVLSNRSTDHAAIVLENLFKAAQHSVEIISNGLNPKVYDKEEVVDALRQLLSHKDCRVEILVESEVDGSRAFLEALAEYPEKTSVIRVPQPIKQLYSYNFCVVDDDCYRFEPNREQCDATIQFGNIGIARKIHEAFCEIKQTCLSHSSEHGKTA